VLPNHSEFFGDKVFKAAEEGMYFVGWNTARGEEADPIGWYFPGNTVDKDISLYARWSNESRAWFTIFKETTNDESGVTFNFKIELEEDRPITRSLSIASFASESTFTKSITVTDGKGDVWVDFPELDGFNGTIKITEVDLPNNWVNIGPEYYTYTINYGFLGGLVKEPQIEGERNPQQVIFENEFRPAPAQPASQGGSDWTPQYRPQAPAPVTITEEPTPLGEAPAPVATPEDIPQTGIGGNLFLWLLLIGMSIIALSVLIITKKRRGQHSEI